MDQWCVKYMSHLTREFGALAEVGAGVAYAARCAKLLERSVGPIDREETRP